MIYVSLLRTHKNSKVKGVDVLSGSEDLHTLTHIQTQMKYNIYTLSVKIVWLLG